MFRQRVHKRVGGCIMSLTDRSQDRRGRGIHHKKIELQSARSQVEIPSSVNLRAHHSMACIRCQIAQQRVLQYTGRVDNPGQPRARAPNFNEQILGLLAAANIDGSAILA